jgi:hypothetical protein
MWQFSGCEHWEAIVNACGIDAGFLLLELAGNFRLGERSRVGAAKLVPPLRQRHFN